MPAKTPDSVLTENFGQNTLYIATFSTNDIDDADTWTSNIPSVIAQWANATDNPTQEKEGIDVGLTTVATGVFTFYTAENNRTGQLYVLAKT